MIESVISSGEFYAGNFPINKLSIFLGSRDVLDGRIISNHSERATLCTTLYNIRSNDKVLVSRSGHRFNSIQK